MEKYNEAIAENPKVVMIHLSQDRDEDSAEEWATANNFPWLTILPKDVPRSDLMEYRTRNAVPHYTLRDKDGNEIANGSSAIFAKLKDLGSSSE